MGMMTLLFALEAFLSRTSLSATNLIVIPANLPATTQELVACLQLKCNATLTAVGLKWSDADNARLLHCLTHSDNASVASSCWTLEDSTEGKAVQSCAVCNSCVPGRCSADGRLLKPNPRVVSHPQPSSGNPMGPPGGDGGFDWSKYLGSAGGDSGWMKFIPGASPPAPSPTPLQRRKRGAEPLSAVVSLPVVPVESHAELIACLNSKCSTQTNTLGASWSNPVNTALMACLATSKGGLDAAVNCFPPVNPDQASSYEEATALRYCGLCSACLAGDRGSIKCAPPTPVPAGSGESDTPDVNAGMGAPPAR